MGKHLKIYLASRVSFGDKCREIANVLKNRGHTITAEWWDFPKAKDIQATSDAAWFMHERIKYICDRDLQAVKDCDVLVLVSTEEGIDFRGALVELGYALALGKTCLSVGKLSRCALFYSVHKCDSLTELFSHINYLSNSVSW